MQSERQQFQQDIQEQQNLQQDLLDLCHPERLQQEERRDLQDLRHPERRQREEQEERQQERRPMERQQERECLTVESSPSTGMLSEDENETGEN